MHTIGTIAKDPNDRRGTGCTGSVHWMLVSNDETWVATIEDFKSVSRLAKPGQDESLDRALAAIAVEE